MSSSGCTFDLMSSSDCSSDLMSSSDCSFDLMSSFWALMAWSDSSFACMSAFCFSIFDCISRSTRMTSPSPLTDAEAERVDSLLSFSVMGVCSRCVCSR